VSARPLAVLASGRCVRGGGGAPPSQRHGGGYANSCDRKHSQLTATTPPHPTDNVAPPRDAAPQGAIPRPSDGPRRPGRALGASGAAVGCCPDAE
jgi:hypothetical protein